jgi:phosphate starvation-inducible PhoH-like protein
LKEIIIPIEFANAVDFYGVNDANLELLRKKFPALKIVSRGNEIKILGDEIQIGLLMEKINRLVAYFQDHGKLNAVDVEHLVNGVTQEMPKAADGGKDVLLHGPHGLLVRARTPNQRKLVESTLTNDIVFAIGPAGTGKTYTAVALAVRALKNKEIKRIVLTRPAVEAGENLGFLPGDLKEKIDPYLRPLYDALYDMIPGEKLQSYIENGIIEVAPLAFMRGRTLDHSYVILDEAQNATENQLKMFLTRMGPSAKFIVTGDVTQIDLPRNQPSGLIQSIKLLKSIKGIDFIHLDQSDVVRHRLVRDIINAYSNHDNEVKK